jgi:tRNA-dihydrouridine synthase 2
VLPDIGGVDVNMGCPKKFSTQGGMGSALMRDVMNAKTIMKALVDNFADKISVSCKIRVLKTFQETLEYVLAMQEAGVHWISIHPRTAAEESRVPARWYTVKKLLDTGLIKIPVLGSGDLFSPLCVHKYLSYTGASGVILARGAIHNPRIFLLKSRLLDREVPLIESGNHTSHEEDWKESLLEPSSSTEESPSKLEEELAANTGNLKKKSGKSEYEEESIEFS